MRFKDLYPVVDARYLHVADENCQTVLFLSISNESKWIKERRKAKQIAEADEYIVTKVSIADGINPFIVVEVEKDSSKT